MSLVSFNVTQHKSVNEVHEEWMALDGGAGPLASGYPACRAWYEAFSQNKKCEPLILCGRDGVGKPVFLLPLVKQTYGPFTVIIRPAMKHLAYYSGLFDPQFASQIDVNNTHEFWQKTVGSVEGVDAMWLDGICDPAARKGQPMSYLDHFISSNPCSIMHLEEDWDTQYQDITSSKKRSNDRRMVRHIEEHGVYQFRVAETLDDKLTLKDVLFSQKSEFFDHTGDHDPFESDEIREFYTKMIEIDHNSGSPRYVVAGIYVNDQLLAGILGGRQSDIFHGMVISRCHGELARYSPGRLLLIEMNKYLSDQGIVTHNFGTGAFEYKDKWCDGDMDRRHVTFAVNSKGMLFIKLLKLGAQIKRAIKRRHLEGHPVIGKLREAFNI